ncbi:peptidase inhibitor family I36 protein [Streptomyces sp. CA-288835]|uniref:peptidase inhibitor family I36 protein n=1 Tax=Streptomyces sp. CA-288835 TaxID=3240069 RepID=UPI003D9383EC
MRGHRLVKQLSMTGAAVFASVALGVLGAPPAAADSSDCQPNWFCMWENSSYGGRLLTSPAQNVSNIGLRHNDLMTSYWNRTDQWITVYDDSGYRGCLFAIPPGGSDNAVDPHLNDRVTSFAVGKWC